MAFIQQYSRTEPKSITRRREVEEARNVLNDRVARDFAVNESAKWENRTHAIMQTSSLAAVTRVLKQKDQVHLQQRRAKLAMMLTHEDEMFRDELLSQAESATDRAKRLVKEARRVKGEREEKRQNFADEQLERQWKDGCDELRTIDSAYFKVHCTSEVLKQISDKQIRKSSNAHEDSRWAAEWEGERMKSVAKEEGRADARERALIANRRDLKSQMDDATANKASEFATRQKEKEIFQKILDMDAEASRVKATRELERKRSAQRDTVAFNEQVQYDREESYRLQRLEDKRYLVEKMEQYKEDTIRVENDKQAQKRDIIEFKAYLEKRKEEERLMEREMDRLVQEDLDRSNLQRDMQWDRERLAREQLMSEVYAGRSAQMSEAASIRRREEDELYMEKRAAELEIARAAEDEYREAQAEHLAAARRLRDLDSQVAINRDRKRLAKEELERELRAAQEAERKYKLKLDSFRSSAIEQAKANYNLEYTNPTSVLQQQNQRRQSSASPQTQQPRQQSPQNQGGGNGRSYRN